MKRKTKNDWQHDYDPKSGAFKGDPVNHSRGDDDLGSSISDDLHVLRKSENESKRELQVRKNFIQKKYKIIASYYNNYKFIDYTKKTNRKIAKKQMLDIVNVLDKNLHDMELFFDKYDEEDKIDYKVILVGIITFKHLKKETLKKVNLDLKKLFEKGKQLDFDPRLLNALERILVPFGL